MTSNQSHPRGSIHEQLQACLAPADTNRSHQLSNDSLKAQTTCCFQMTLLYLLQEEAVFKLGVQPYASCSLRSRLNFTFFS